jgi:hypothetical protein
MAHVCFRTGTRLCDLLIVCVGLFCLPVSKQVASIMLLLSSTVL